MRRLVLVVLLSVCLPAAARAGLPAPVTLDGFGGAVPGLTPTQTAARWGIALRLSGEDPACQTATIAVGALQGYAIFENGRLGAVFLRRGARTGKGVGIGSTERQVRAAYPQIVVQPHKYLKGGRYLFVSRARAPHWRIRLDTSAAGRVIQIGFGSRAVAYVEGCA
jgi:hypothetical protein